MTLRISVEIVPHGDENAKCTLAVVNVHNRGQVEMPWPGTWCVYSGEIYVRGDGQGGDVIKLDGIVHRREDGFAKLAKLAIEKLSLYVKEA